MTNAMRFRKLGLLEEASVLIHNQKASACSVGAVLKVKQPIDFNLFCQAWEILFLRQPMLQARYQQNDEGTFFHFDVPFQHIPIRFSQTEDSCYWKACFDYDITRSFQIDQYLWRTQLIRSLTEPCSYILFGAMHAICDGMSISALLGELLSILSGLQNGEIPHRNRYPLLPVLETVFDPYQFAKDAAPTEVPQTQFTFHQATNTENAISSNLLFEINSHTLANILKACRKRNLTFTHYVSACLYRHLHLIQPNLQDTIYTATAFNLRPYTQPLTPTHLLSAYAHYVTYPLNLTQKGSIWTLAREVKQRLDHALKHYALPKKLPNHHASDILARWGQSSATSKFLFPICISNLGRIDAAYHTAKSFFDIDFFHFTVAQHGLGHPLILFISTLNNKLQFNFSFAEPALDANCVAKLAQKTLRKLITSSHIAAGVPV